MLVKYSKDYKKIAMGFMSYIPELKDIDHLEMEIALYDSDEHHQLLLYKNQNADFAGIVALELQELIVMVRYISLSPAYRSHKNMFSILDELQQFYPNCKIMGTIELTPLIEMWKNSKNKVQNND